MCNVDNFFQKSHYNIIRVLLSISGLWTYQTISRRCAIYFVFLLVFGSGLTFEVLGMIQVWPDSLEVVDCLPLLALGAVSIIKLICTIYSLSEIGILLTRIQEYWYSPKSNEETNILDSYALYGRNLGYAYTGILLSHTVVFVFATLLTKIFHVPSTENDTLSLIHDAQAGLPYRVDYMIDLDTYYVPIFIHTAICDVSYTILIITFDVLYLTLVQHCCGLFAALRYRLEYVLKFEDDNNSMLMSTKEKLRSNLVYSIRRHAEAIQFAAIIESIHRLPLFLHVGVFNMLVLSILGFQVVTHTEDINRTLKHASYLSALLLNTFFENWQGQKIIDSSEKVFESAYNAEWYKMPAMERKFLMMVMMRSKRTSKITAANFIILSHVNFNAVLRASSSYFMLLRSTQ